MHDKTTKRRPPKRGLDIVSSGNDTFTIGSCCNKHANLVHASSLIIPVEVVNREIIEAGASVTTSNYTCQCFKTLANQAMILFGPGGWHSKLICKGCARVEVEKKALIGISLSAVSVQKIDEIYACLTGSGYQVPYWAGPDVSWIP
jgi:hypothetical protein